MNKHLTNVVKLAFFLALGALLVWLAIKDFTPAQKTEIISSITRANYFWVALSLFLGLSAHISRSIRWNMLMNPMGYRPKLLTTLSAVMLGYLVNLGIPRGGEIVRCGIINRYEKVPLQRVIGTMITERIVDVISLLVVFLLAFIIEFDTISNFVQENVISKFGEKFAAIPAMAIAVILIVMVSSLFVLYRLRNFFRNLQVYHKFKTFVKGLLEGVQAIRQLENPLLFIFHSVFIWVLYFVMMYVCFFSLAETSHLGFGECMAILAVGSVAMIVTPGGIGAYPAFIQTILFVYAIDKPIGFAFGWIVWGAQFVGIIVGGILALIILPMINPAIKPLDEPEEAAVIESI